MLCATISGGGLWSDMHVSYNIRYELRTLYSVHTVCVADHRYLTLVHGLGLSLGPNARPKAGTGGLRRGLRVRIKETCHITKRLYTFLCGLSCPMAFFTNDDNKTKQTEEAAFQTVAKEEAVGFFSTTDSQSGGAVSCLKRKTALDSY